MARRPVLEDGFELAIRLLFAEDDLQRDVLVPGGAAGRCDATSLEAQDGTGIGAFGDVHAHRPADRRHGDLAAQHGFGERYRQLETDVVADAAEERMRRDMHFDQRIARRAAAEPGLALALEPQDLPIGDASGDRYVERLPPAGLHGAEIQPLLGAARRLEEIDGEGEGAVGAAHPEGAPAARAAAASRLLAEQVGEDIAEIVLGDAAFLVVFGALRPFGVAPIGGAFRPLLAGRVDLAAIEARALLGVGEQLVGGADRLEACLRLLVPGVEVGVILLGELAVGAADLLGARIALDAEDRIRVVSGHRFALPSGLLRRWQGLVDPQLHAAVGAAALDGQRDLVVDRGEANTVAQLAGAAHRRAVDPDDDVARAQPGALGRRARLDAADDRPLAAPRAGRRGEFGRQVLDGDADASAFHRTVADDLFHGVARHVDRHREADADIAAAGGEDGCVDADETAPEVGQRAARVGGDE